MLDNALDFLWIRCPKELRPAKHGADIISESLADLFVLSGVLDLFCRELFSELWRDVAVDFAKVT